MDTNLLLTEREVAEVLGKTIVTLNRWRREGYGPAYVRVGRTPRYTREALSLFMSENSIRPGGRTA